MLPSNIPVGLILDSPDCDLGIAGEPVFYRRVKKNSQFACDGLDGSLRTFGGRKSAAERSHGTPAFGANGLGGQPQGLRGRIAGAAGPVADIFAACPLAARTQIQPADKMLRRWPFAHLCSAYTQDVRQHFFIESFLKGQVCSRDTFQIAPYLASCMCRILSDYPDCVIRNIYMIR
jgi:hypothetical protein